jgi:hypothetical protein
VSGDDADYEGIRTAIEKNNLFFEGAGSVAIIDAKEPTPTAIGVEGARIAATGPAARDATPLPIQ